MCRMPSRRHVGLDARAVAEADAAEACARHDFDRALCLVDPHAEPPADLAQGQNCLASEYQSRVDVQERRDHARGGELRKPPLICPSVKDLIR